ncbi:hypothetical protein EJ03DRAFT_84284 [Teratosphaeria nubilosa]|uniref:Uncharacterized protein n=1 Tax=Teratosphaeria nubilosa TaxID=161662 RepID=A0A6G1LB63_9PEZI|nr:hypothetical protein EJ03DRAFT_84284 [Teratosphaeria nubilosa]
MYATILHQYWSSLHIFQIQRQIPHPSIMAQQDSPSTPNTKVYASTRRQLANHTPRQSCTQHQNQTWRDRLFPRDSSGQSQLEVKEIPRPGHPTKPVGTPDALPTPRIEVPNAATFTMPQFFSHGSEVAFNPLAKGPWEPRRQDCFSESESQLQRSNGESSSNMPLNKFLNAILPLVEPVMNSIRPDGRKELDCLVEVRKWARENPNNVPRGDSESAKVALEKEQYEWLKAAQGEVQIRANSDSRRFTSSSAGDRTITPSSVRQTAHDDSQHLAGQISPSPGQRGNTTPRNTAGHPQQLISPHAPGSNHHQALVHDEREPPNTFSKINAAMHLQSQGAWNQQKSFQPHLSPFASTDMSYASNPYLTMASSAQHAYPLHHHSAHYAQVPSQLPLQYQAPWPQTHYQQPAGAEIPRPRNLPTAVWAFLNIVNPMVASIKNSRDREEMVTQWAYGHMVQVPLISSQVLDLSDDEQRLLWAAQKVLPAESRMHLFGAK